MKVMLARYRHQLAAIELCRWVQSHLDRFEPKRCTHLPVLEDVKPLGELLLILLALQGPPHLVAQTMFLDWARHASAQLWDFVESYAGSIPWKIMTTVISDHPQAAIPLTIVPLIETLTGKESSFHHEVRQTIAEALRCTREASINLSFAGDIAGTADCAETACKCLRDETLILRRNGAECSSTLYTITHAIFYATRMGHRPLSFSEAGCFDLCARLVRFGEERLANGDYDLGSELLLSACWTCPQEAAQITDGCESLALMAKKEGSIPPHPRLLRASADNFENRYHPTLVALAALAEYMAAAEIAKGVTL
jgi:hypothetical protein